MNSLSEEGDDQIRAAYGTDRFARLAKIKTQYDPGSFFRLDTNIPPAE